MQNLTFNGRYRVLQQLGAGGFGLTYLAEDWHLPTRPRCVVKHLRPQSTDAETMQLANRLFQQEAEILYRLGGHPNIPSLIAHFKENGEFYLVQEFIEGHTLDREFVAGKRYNQKEIVQFLGQMLEILAFVHAQKVIHRDIKPANIIRRRADGNLSLIDFGAVKQVSATPRAPQSSTFSSVTIGSHGYMPMEQMAGNPNFASDLYALGLVTIEALTGIKPLDLPKNSATSEFVWAHKAQLAPELEHFITKLVRMDFRQRFFSASEALANLNPIAARIGFFNQRAPVQPPAPAMMTVQPIRAAQANFQPPPVADPHFIPPTVIVPQNSPLNFPPPANRIVEDRGGKNAKIIFFAVAGVLFFIGFLFVAGKILNFRWSSLREGADQRRESAPVASKSTANIDIYGEALKQAEEAQAMEKNATTKFEWEQITNKYKRAYLLLGSIEQANPRYAEAQEKIPIFKELAEKAESKIATAETAPTLSGNSNTPMVAIETETNPNYQRNYQQNPALNAPRRRATMPPPQRGRMYLAYNSSDGDYIGAGKTVVLTDGDGNFSIANEYNGQIRVRFDGGSDSWTLTLAPPKNAPQLAVGYYGGAERAPFQSPTRPGLDFSGSGRGCNRLSGSYNISRLVYAYDEKTILQLHVTFTQFCEEGGSPLMGRLQYDVRY